MTSYVVKLPAGEDDPLLVGVDLLPACVGLHERDKVAVVALLRWECVAFVCLRKAFDRREAALLGDRSQLALESGRHFTELALRWDLRVARRDRRRCRCAG